MTTLGLEEEKKTPDANLSNHHESDATVKSGANWFYWIAGLSVINSLIYVSGSEWQFLAGLGITQLADGFVDVAIENGAPSAMKAVSLVFSLIVVAFFALLGYYAGNRSSMAFVIGIVIYLLDGLLVLLLGEFVVAGFHAFALFFLIRGFLACRQANAIDRARAFAPPPPPPATL